LSLSQDSYSKEASLSPTLLKSLLISLLLINTFTYANNVTIDHQFQSIVLGPHIEYLEDKKGSLVLNDVMASQLDSLWLSSNQEAPNFGFSDSVFWFRSKITTTEHHPEKLILELKYPLLDKLEIILITPDQPKGQSTDHWVMGDHQNFSLRPIIHRYFVASFIPTIGETWIYLKLQSSSSIQLPLTLWSEKAFHEQDQISTIIQGAYFGIMLIIISYNMLIYAFSAARSYLYYIFYVFFLASFMAIQQGLTFQYLWPNFSEINLYSIPISMNLTSLFGTLFIIRFLKLQTYTPVLAHRLVGLCAIITFLIPLVLIINYMSSIIIATGIGLIVSMVSLYAGARSWQKGYQPARYIVFGIGSLIFGLIIFALNKYGFIPHNVMTQNSAQIGSLIDITFLSLALAERIHLERKQKVDTQEKMLRTTKEKIRLEERLLHSAVHDHYTGLPNRNMLAEVVPNILKKYADKNSSLAFMLIYLNNFQDINNTLGHQNASRLLAAVASRISGCTEIFVDTEILSNIDGATHRLASVEGVSFALILTLERSPHAAQKIAEHINQTMQQPFELNGMAIEVGVSIGISYFPEHGHEFNNLLRHTQVAVEVAQHTDKQYSIYDPSIDTYSARRLALMGELRQAINDNNLTLYFQPKVDIQKNQVLGMEALLRWEHPVHGMLPPDEFIPLAEQTGIIKPLTRWVVEAALGQLKTLREKGYQLSVAVNLSARNLQEQDILNFLQEMLEKHQLPASALVLEVTETAMMQDPDHALQTLKRISDMGIALSIDDFGTGYSSLAYLKQMPVQEIKIDRSFVTDMINDKDDSIIVNTTLNMSHNLGLRVTAEGVEDKETLLKLRALGCNAVQGYFLTRPIPAKNLEEWLLHSEFDVVKLQRKVHQLNPQRKNK